MAHPYAKHHQDKVSHRRVGHVMKSGGYAGGGMPEADESLAEATKRKNIRSTIEDEASYWKQYQRPASPEEPQGEYREDYGGPAGSPYDTKSYDKRKRG